MDQKTYLEVTAMLNSFPQGASDPDVLIATIERATADISDRAISETARRFVCGEIEDQSRTFAPSVAEFVQAARKIEKLVPFMGQPRIPSLPAKYERYHEPTPESRIRMGFKLSVLSAGIARREVDKVADANASGLDELMALAQTWGVSVPEELFAEGAEYDRRRPSAADRSVPVFILMEKLRAKNAHREVLHENVNLEQWQKMSKARAIPVGASWIAALGTVYGPEPKSA